MRIGLIAIDGCFGSAVASIIDIVRVADGARGDVDPRIDPIELAILGPKRRVTTTTSMTLSVDHPLSESGEFDVVVVPALGPLTAAATNDALQSRDARSVIASLGRLDEATTRIAAACTGVFAVAETGRMHHRRATTSWFLGPEFLKRYPTVALDLDTMVVVDGNLVTAGAAFAHIDLAISLVRSISPDLAQHFAKLLIIDERPSQAAFIAYEHLRHEDPIVVEFERFVRARLDEPFNVAFVAHRSAQPAHPRTTSPCGAQPHPLGFVQRLRIERARHLSATTDLTSAEIALRVGYANAETLRSLLRRERRRS